jgi:hypothetical protein
MSDRINRRNRGVLSNEARKIWEFSTNLHCSIIGTCLSTAELRQVLRKFSMGAEGYSDHDLHATAVSMAMRRDDAARQLHKTLDHRHKLAVSQFGKASSEDAVRAIWRDVVRRCDIPGAWSISTLSRNACSLQATFLLHGAKLEPRDRNDDGGLG